MNELRVFNNPEFGTIRTIVEDGKTLFCGRDVAMILGYAKPQNAISKRCKGALKRGTPTPSGIQEMLFIPESDLYRLAFGSTLPTAEKFTDWVVEEVLPSIRQTGAYMQLPQTHPALPDGVTFSSAVGFMRLTRRVMLDMGASPFDVGMMIKQTCEAISFPVPPALSKQIQGQIDLFGRPGLEAVQ